MPNETKVSLLNSPMTKRSFLAGTAASMALSAQSFGVRNAMAQNAEWDLIIVGGGTTGMPAALFATERGARVLLIDKAPQLGGTLDRTGGQVAAAGTIWQKEQGITDSPDAHYDDVMRINRHTSDPVLTRLLVDNAADTINWYAARGYTVLDGHPVLGSGHEFFTTRRYQWNKDAGQGFQNILDPMIEEAKATGRLSVLLSTGATDLITDDSGAVRGVVAENDSGERVDYRSRFVVLSSGGCAANPRMYQELHGMPLYWDIAYPYSQGDGITLGLGAGGYVRGGDMFAPTFGQILESNHFPAPISASAVLEPRYRMPWEVFVNVHGKRFVQEDHPSLAHREYTLSVQPGHRHWAIFDQEILDTAPPLIPRWSREKLDDAFIDHPMFAKAATIGELGVKAGINPYNLERDIAAYNDGVLNDAPDDMGREHRPLPIAKGPFYAVQLQGATVKSAAGLAVDGELRVTRNDGTPIPNLYAAGEVIGGAATSGQALTNGMGMTPALTFGRLLGQKIIPLTS
ncbi:MAG: FAD-dependent oxidoreductase [Rhodospirillaceae bacterium]|jgi:fumarate reductase flavoprotein subunit|nr:FAD-dependent oxidoreductase [Rhodospirillaceae bacterium]MBT5240354.1 FAD-dependent oxidoreductase [Rhodospirillaceae bacterium]MBT5566993.1 FAD-dependent oxidoreductase [Rhodospirillaceae bacterium]MBT6088260.1 FAD-dependent oxidoreductase [Rhodospirillaceae bacterium]MBT6961485.1 FAD-dependent oxidoreductase [Rhodospirillaceae bacterium]